MRKRLATALVVLAVIAAACGDDEDAPTVGEGAEDTEKAGAQTLPIRVDAQTAPFATSWIHFFPSKVTARPGDSLEFTSEFTGETHTVMAGTLVDEILEAQKKAGPQEDGPPPPELQALFEKIPKTFIEGEPKEGEEFLLQPGNQPCYSATDDPSTDEPCPVKELPEEFTGKARFINTGYMEDEDTFKIKLADDLKTGTYTFICAIHGSDMAEEVTVVAKSADIPTAEEVKAAGEKELGDFMAKLKPAADEVLVSIDAKSAKAGTFFEGEEPVPSAGINVFPTELPIKEGESVTWEVNGFHSISFNAPEDARPWILKADDGTVSSNQKTLAPANSPKLPAPPAPPEGEGGGGGGGPGEEGPPPQVKVDGGRWDGKGFMSSGVILSEAQLVYTRTFTEAGTFKYICLVHPDMEGTVKVT
ncbi:MAG TPA: hypothetical protein VNA57_02415 [Acidimicrobiales bacterium]|nr:hypothetical protein [Acidimicrobiales bacterium]